jgi:hypothetical protein
MAPTAGLDVFQNIATFDWLNLALKIGNVLLVLFITWVLVYFLILRPKKFKYKITILDVTSGSLLMSYDRGGWVDQPSTGTGEFRLMKDKNARLQMPSREVALTNKTGKICWTFIKFGESPFDYGVLDYRNVKEGLPKVISLADIAWARASIQRASMKKELGKGWFANNKSFVVTITACVMAMIIMSGAIKFAADSSQQTISASVTASEKIGGVSDSLERIADELSSDDPAYNPYVPPP